MHCLSSSILKSRLRALRHACNRRTPKVRQVNRWSVRTLNIEDEHESPPAYADTPIPPYADTSLSLPTPKFLNSAGRVASPRRPAVPGRAPNAELLPEQELSGLYTNGDRFIAGTLSDASCLRGNGRRLSLTPQPIRTKYGVFIQVNVHSTVSLAVERLVYTQ